MTQLSTWTCDAPACIEIAEDIEDEDDLIATGWFVVTFQVTPEDEDPQDRIAHLHSYACLKDWAEEGMAWDE